MKADPISFEIWVKQGRRSPQRFALAGPLSIGRDPSCDIVLDSQFASRRHARVEERKDGWVIVDEGSRNGIELNGRRAPSPARLREGDEVRIADAWLSFRRTSEVESTRLWSPQDAEARRPEAPLYVDTQAREVWICGRKLEPPLSKQEFDLLALLYERAGAVCLRPEIGEAIWGAERYDDGMLYRLVFRLKEKLERDPSRPRFVVNVPGVGYKLEIPDAGRDL